MKRLLTFLLITCAGLAAAVGLSRAPAVLAEWDVFRVRKLRLDGARFLTGKEASRFLDLPSSASVWDELDPWEARMEEHPLVREARIRRWLPWTLVLEVEEADPVALVATPTLEPVDEDGRILPIDPAEHRLDLPLITPGEGRRGEEISPSERKRLAAEVAGLAELDPTFLTRISEMALDRRGQIEARIWDPDQVQIPPVVFRFPTGLTGDRIGEAFRVLGDARARFGDSRVTALDLRYDDQVVVRLRPPTGS